MSSSQYEPLSGQEADPSSTTASSNKSRMTKHVIYRDSEYAPNRPIQTIESQISSSLFLQQLMYYNTFYSIVFVYLYLSSQVYRFLYLNPWAAKEYGVPVRFILLMIFVPLEYFRLTNGFAGNLKQTFPQMLAFFLLTIFSIAIQLLCMTIVNASPLEWAMLLYGVIMHSLELIVCVYSLKGLTQAQTALFFWRSPGASKIKINYKRRFNA